MEAITNKQFAWGLGLATGIGLWVGYCPPEYAYPFLVVAAGLLLGLFLVWKTEPGDQMLPCLFLGAFAARILACLYLYFRSLGTASEGFFIPDGWGYSYNGRWLSQMWHRGIYPAIEDITKIISQSGHWGGYDTWNTYVYYVTGYSPLTLMFINCLVGSLTVLLVYWLTRLLSNRGAARMAACLTALWPSLFLWSTQNLKDIWVVAALLLAMLSAVYFVHTHKGFALAGLATGFFILKAYRFWTIVPVCAGLGVGLLLYLLRRFFGKCEREIPGFHPIYLAFVIIFGALLAQLPRVVSEPVMWVFWGSLLFFLRRLSWKRTALLGGLLAASFYVAEFFHPSLLLVQERLFNPLMNRFMDIPNLLNWLNHIREGTATGESAIFPRTDLTSIFRILMFLPVGLAYLLLAPFPWQLGTSSHMIAALQSLCMYGFIPLGIVGIVRYHRRASQNVFLLFFLLSLMGIMAIVEGNMGTLFRHKDMVLVFWFVYVGIGLQGMPQKASAASGARTA